jgi:predicted metal-binding membrane protein
MTRSDRRIDRPRLSERPPSGQLHYGAYRGRLRDVRAGAHHGAYCLGCCWSLMALFVVVG